MLNRYRVLFLMGLYEGTMPREEQLMYLNELLHERGLNSAIALELNTVIKKIRFLQQVKSGIRKVEEFMTIQAETWYHFEGKYRLAGTDKWITRAEYHSLPEPEACMLVRKIYYL